ncbi:MAG: hypothetical protein H0T51_13950 [Pirellulales bacterium]|nr:hypothetical protein [Pirellulales bacterium]
MKNYPATRAAARAKVLLEVPESISNDSESVTKQVMGARAVRTFRGSAIAIS